MAMGNEMPNTEELPALAVSRTFPASRDLVFRAWTSADHLRHWFCPADYSVAEARVECRVGGDFQICMRSPQGEDHWIKGKYAEVVPNARLVIDMQVLGAQDRPLFRALTAVTFDEVRGGGTRLEVTQTYTLFDPLCAHMLQGAPQGWRQTLDRLEHEVKRIGRSADVRRSAAHGTFCIERTYPVSRAQVFRALTNPAAKAKWFAGGAGYTLLSREMDVRPGGRERVSGRWDSGTVSTFDAVYHDIVADERLVYSYEMHLDDRKISVSLATFELKSAAEGTRLVMTEQGVFLDGYDDAGSRERGSNYLLDALGKSLAH